jgi:hypothetical protein
MENFRINNPDIQIISAYHPELWQYTEFFQISNYGKTPKEVDGAGSGCNTPQALFVQY